MALKIEKLKIDNSTYEIRELPVKVLLPLSTRLSENSVEAQIELIGAAVSVDGKLLGADAGDIRSSVYMKLVSKVLAVNGLSTQLGNEN